MRRSLLLALLLLPACAGPGPRGGPSAASDRLLTLRDYLSGSFSSAAQARADSEYFAIDLHATPMWTWRDDGPWLYVEQAMAATPGQPYRQRVYKLERSDDGRLWSRVFVLNDPEAHAGAWASGSPLSELSPADLEERVGCAIALTWDDGRSVFIGSTTGTGCPSELAGASYATSQVVLGPDRMLTWDRGFDATGRQVWGAAQGGYEFIRVD